jgi:hypothetical protein
MVDGAQGAAVKEMGLLFCYGRCPEIQTGRSTELVAA